MNNLLTEQLQASIQVQRIAMRMKQLERAQMYMTIADEAARRLLNHIEAVEQYDEAAEQNEPWTLILSKKDAEKRVRDTQAAYRRCEKAYRGIILSLNQY